jgi:hypothetical protein
MVLISDQLGEPNGSSKCRYRGSGLHMVIAPRAREASVQISHAIGDAPVAKRAANLVQFPFGMIVEPAGSSFLTAQKTRGRAHRFFACHFLAYAAQGGQSDRTPKGRKRSLCNVASTSTSAADLLCRAPARHLLLTL